MDLQPGEHLPLRYNVFPSGSEELPPYPLSGGAAYATDAYIFSYPFDLVAHPAVTEIREITVAGETLTVYPPFRSRPANEPSVEAVPAGAIPYRPGTTAPNADWLNGASAKLDEREVSQRRNCLRVDTRANKPYQVAADTADRLVGIIRWLTKQWWIKRGAEHPRTHIRHWFHANELGERVAGIGSFRFFYGRMGYERVLDSTLWRSAIATLVAGHCIPLSWDLFLDAIYFHASDDLRRSVLELAISNEIALSEFVVSSEKQGRITRAQAKSLLRGNDFIAHLKRVGALFNCPYEVVFPTEFYWTKAVWIARGSIAHGQPPLVPFPDGTAAITLKHAVSMIAAGFSLREWLATLAKSQS